MTTFSGTRRLSTLRSGHLWTFLVITVGFLSIECRAWTTARTTSQQQRIILGHVSPSSTLLRTKTDIETTLNETTDDHDGDDDDNDSTSFSIRSCRYGDLSIVSEMIVNSFYAEKMRKSPFAAVLRLGELNRLQQNFPYNDDRHYMFLAVDSIACSENVATNDDDDNNNSNNNNNKEEIIVGFVDLDARPATRRIDPPRPYLSDLAVHPDHRRRGIATTLIQKCEGLAQSQFQKPSLYIRVEEANDAAVQMYEQFEYQQMEHDVFGVEDTTVLLRKDFDGTDDEEQTDQNDDDREPEDPVLDFVV